MFKFILILVLVMYAIYRIGGFFFKVFSSGYQGHEQQQQQQQTRVDKNPNQGKKPFEGGEYVDYEEVK